MKLYYSPAAGSLASHITVRELKLDVDLVKVDVQNTRETEFGDKYDEINPKGYVPFLSIDADTNLSEGTAILQYLADQDPGGKMMPREGTLERYRSQEWLTFVSTELQRIIGSFFIPDHLTEAGLEFRKMRLHQRLTIMDSHLSKNEYLMGSQYSVADAYAFAILNWIPAFKLDTNLGIHINKYTHLSSYLEKIRSREAVQAVMREEGLVK